MALQSIYNTSRWLKLRDLKIKTDPLCERCLAGGVVRPAKEVHHIIPIDVDDLDNPLAYDWDNLKSVCIPCHKQEHIELKRQGKG